MSSPSISLKFPAGHPVEKVAFETGLFINNKFVPALNGRTIDVINPSTDKKLGVVSEAGAADIDVAVEAADKAYRTVWGERVPASQRGRLLSQFADAIEAHADTIASIESIDNGKPFGFARHADVAGVIDCFRYFAGWADKHHGKVIEYNEERHTYTRHEPKGVVGQIIPWNFPIMMFAWKTAPALATGNTIVIKVSEATPLSALFVGRLIADIFPPGVVNIVTGYGHVAGAAISSHMKIEKVAFTGSTAVGRSIMSSAAKSNVKDVTLELGGKSANVIFADADLDQAAAWSTFGLFFNGGQVCAAGSRIYVQEQVYDAFLAKLSEKVKSIKVGDAFSEDSFHGPLTSKQQFERVSEHIESGKKEGATVHTGGVRHGTEGYFIQPTIFTDVKPHMRIVKEEIFGPVVTVIKFKDEADVIEQANSSIYGLAAAVFTRDVSRAIKTANALQAGMVWVNCYNQMTPQVPFGGYKQSGIGREQGEEALHNYTNVKSIHINLSSESPFFSGSKL